MAEPLWLTIIVSLGVGSVFSVLLGAYLNYLLKKREQYAEMSRHKMDVIAKLMPTYMQLGSYYDEFSKLLGNRDADVERAFYCASKIFFFEKDIFEKYGTLQLDSLEAEEILSNFELDFGIDQISKDEMREFIRNTTSYKQFVLRYFDSPTLAKFNVIFSKKILEPISKEPNDRQKCDWYCQLIFLEVNEVYYSWYNSHPLLNINSLSSDLKDYLMNNHSDYYKRICKCETKSLL